MFSVSKRMEIAYGHQLHLPYPSKCNNPHGHNGVITVYCKAPNVQQETQMVIDFTAIKEVIHDKFDHQWLNDLVGDVNPTSEYMAKLFCDQLNIAIRERLIDEKKAAPECRCYRVDFQESEGNVATYEED